MRKKKVTLRHRGYLYAQQRTPAFDHETTDSFTKRRMTRAEDWRAGYLAALRDISSVRRGKT